MNLDRGVDCYPSDAGHSPSRDEASPQHTSDALGGGGGSGDEDPLSCHADPGREEPRAKKRRKQSNPVRYHTSRLADGSEDLVAPVQTDAVRVEDLPDGVPSPGDVDSFALNLENPSKRRRGDEPNGEIEGGQRCHHCNVIFATEDQLRMHIEEEHVQKLLEKQLQQQQAGYHRAYGDLSKDRDSSKAALDMASQNQAYLERKPPSSEPDFPKNHPFPFPTMPPLIPISQSGGEAKPGSLPVPLGMFPNPMAPFLFPVLQQGQNAQPPMTNGSATPGGGNMRIFNPEAFCELCNKEFCNKYFLKTHKANKHGIYSVESLVSSPYGPSFFSPSLSNTLSMHQMLQNPMSDPSMAPRQGIINMESFCEICQKEFCNKYFLKKHKQKIHGIVDPSAQQNSASSVAASTANTENSSDRKVSTSPQHVGPSSEPAGAQPSDKNAGQASGEPQQPHPDTFRMDFPSVFPGVNGKFSMSSLTPPTGTVVSSASGSSPIISSSISSDPKSAPSFYNQNSSGSDSGSVFTPEKLREMGVINAEAFCEICCKEFCNKYFLRTHKQNKHGIPAIDSPQKNHQTSQNLPSSQQFPLMSPSMVPPVSASQDTPENLSTPSRGSVGRTSPESAMRSSFSSDFEPTTDLTCEICNRPFSSQYLLKMHKFYTHNIPYVKEEDDDSKSPSPNVSNNNQNANQNKENQNSESKGSRQTEGGNHSEDAASQDLQKLQSMIRDLTASIANENKVTCNVCRAEFDNKYFLRAHMMNEHGVLLNEDGTSLTPGSDSSANQQSRQPPDMPPPPFSAVAFPSPVFDSEAYCEICQKEFCSKYFLKTHKQNIHGISMDGESAPLKKDDAGALKSMGKSMTMVPFAATSQMNSLQPPPLSQLPLPQTQGSEKSRSLVTGRNYCNICNKELCNKYFMKTHMLKMHGINLDEHPADAARNSIIGGVTCEICQKELCSKYFLKVHKQNTHGILEDSGKENSNHSSSAGDQKVDLSSPFQPGEVGEGNRGFNHYTEICPLCDRRFKSIKWLKTHMVNDHSDMLKENVYGRVVGGGAADSALSPGAAKLCIICGQGFPDKVALQIHLIKDHRTTSEELGLMNNSSSDPLAALAQESVKMNGTAERTPPVFKRPSTGGSGGGTRIYHCSYCVYSTRWLSNLYAHEKRHTGVNLEGEKRFVCRVCHRAYRYNHSLQRHLLNHRAAGLSMASLSNLPAVRAAKPQQEHPQDLSSAPADKPSAQQQPSSKVKRYRCSKCNKKFRSRELCLSHIYIVHDAKRPLKSCRPFRCRICGFTTRAWNVLKRHIMKQHSEETAEDKNAGSQSETTASVTPDEDPTKPARTPTPTKTSGSLPMTYAMPQSPPQAGTFIMQPFLIAQPETEDSKNDTFVPSLVYLPVCQKVSQPMTVAFTLTPA